MEEEEYGFTNFPENFKMLDVSLTIKSLNFTLENEFGQRLLVLSLVKINANYQQYKETMTADLCLEDFEIEDMWSKSKIWKRLIEAKEEGVPLSRMGSLVERYEQSQGGKPQALKIHFIAGLVDNPCPYELSVLAEKPLFIVALLPLISEIIRTMNAALQD